MVLAILSKTWWRSLVKGETSEEQLGEETSVPETESLQVAETADFLFDDPEFSKEVEDAQSEDAEQSLSSDDEEATPSRQARSRKGRRERQSEERIPPRARVASAKDFFSEEAIYRFDLLEVHQREELKGDYRVEVKGNKGGVWSVRVQEGLEIVNRREDAPTVFSVQQKDFIQLVNGDLNPQMAILAQKLRVNGDMRQVAAFQSLLIPPGSE
jgi:hypothetical protein